MAELCNHKNNSMSKKSKSKVTLAKVLSVTCIGFIKFPADLTVSKRPGTSYRIEIHFAVFSGLYLLFSFIKLVETW